MQQVHGLRDGCGHRHQCLFAGPVKAVGSLTEKIGKVKADCSNVASLPTLSITLVGKDFDFDFGPDFYVLRVKDDTTGQEQCQLGIQGVNAGALIWILGDPFPPPQVLHGLGLRAVPRGFRLGQAALRRGACHGDLSREVGPKKAACSRAHPLGPSLVSLAGPAVLRPGGLAGSAHRSHYTARPPGQFFDPPAMPPPPGGSGYWHWSHCRGLLGAVGQEEETGSPEAGGRHA